MNRVFLMSFLLLGSTDLVAKPVKPTKKPNAIPAAKPLPAAEKTPPKTAIPETKSIEATEKTPVTKQAENKVTPDLFSLDGSLTDSYFFTGPHNLYLLNPGVTVNSGVYYFNLKHNSQTTYPTSESKLKVDLNAMGQKAFIGYRSSSLPLVAGIGLFRFELNYKLTLDYSSSTYNSDDDDSNTYGGRNYGVHPTLGIVLQNGFYSLLGLDHKATELQKSSKTDARPTLSIGYTSEKLNLGLSHAASKSRGTGDDKEIVGHESQKLHVLYWLSSGLGLDFNLYRVKNSDENIADETLYQDSYSVFLGVDIKGSHSYYSFDIFETTPETRTAPDKDAFGVYYTKYGMATEGKWKVASLYDLGLRASHLQGSGKHTYQDTSSTSSREVSEKAAESTLILELTGGLTF